MKPYILIVEDNSIIYDSIYTELEQHYFEPSDYIKSYDETIEAIEHRRPDLVLLDISLKGDKDGIDLGKILNSKYKIPFIYLTELSDERVFSLGLETNPEEYIVKSKPILDTDQLIRTIRTRLKKLETIVNTQNNNNVKDKILVLTDYLENLRDNESSQITQVPLNYSEIVLFTTKSAILTKLVNLVITDFTITPAKNYSLVLTQKGDVYYLKLSLQQIYLTAPPYFARINEGQIINILPDVFDGKSNHSITVNGLEFHVSDSYKSEFEKKLDLFYNSPK